jgi:hypothetical protein
LGYKYIDRDVSCIDRLLPFVKKFRLIWYIRNFMCVYQLGWTHPLVERSLWCSLVSAAGWSTKPNPVKWCSLVPAATIGPPDRAHTRQNTANSQENHIGPIKRIWGEILLTAARELVRRRWVLFFYITKVKGQMVKVKVNVGVKVCLIK